MKRISVLIDETGISSKIEGSDNLSFKIKKNIITFGIEDIVQSLSNELLVMFSLLENKEWEVNFVISNVFNQDGVKIRTEGNDELSKSIKESISRISKTLNLKLEINFLKTLDVFSKYSEDSFEGKRVYYLWVGDSISGKMFWENGEPFMHNYLDSEAIGKSNVGEDKLEASYSLQMIKNIVALTSDKNIEIIKDVIELGRTDKNIRHIYDKYRDAFFSLLSSITLHLEPDFIVFGGPSFRGMKIKDAELFRDEFSKLLPKEYIINLECILFEYDVKKILDLSFQL